MAKTIITEAETMKAKTDAHNDHMARITKARKAEAVGEKSNLKRKIAVGKALQEARETMANWKVSFKSIYEAFGMAKSSADFYCKLWTDRDKIADCADITEAKAILYPKSQSKDAQKKGKDKGKATPTPRTDAQKLDDVVKGIGRLKATHENFDALMTAMAKRFPEAIKAQVALKIAN